MDINRNEFYSQFKKTFDNDEKLKIKYRLGKKQVSYFDVHFKEKNLPSLMHFCIRYYPDQHNCICEIYIGKDRDDEEYNRKGRKIYNQIISKKYLLEKLVPLKLEYKEILAGKENSAKKIWCKVKFGDDINSTINTLIEVMEKLYEGVSLAMEGFGLTTIHNREEWIISASPQKYDVINSFNDLVIIDWTKTNATKNIKEGDIVYIYVSVPKSKIMIKTICVETNSQLPLIDDNKYYTNNEIEVGDKEYFHLKHIKTIDDDKLSLSSLKTDGLLKMHVQGSLKKSSKNKTDLFNYLNDCFNDTEEVCSKIYIEEAIRGVPEKYKETIIKARVCQNYYRNTLIDKYKCKCALCNINKKELLIASHIKPYAESDESEFLDKNNGLLLCANHDRLFDNFLISFNENGKIIISSNIDKSLYSDLNICTEMEIELNNEMKRYLEYHRKKLL
ncbi:HNH endonuclease [Breznakia pachnodae]|uniref:HNH nuclease domain-containing protein n=1 Tax=Breznakia pachnodae TaxID=265178 RepID=A0ABU0E5E8_9FIRM|nr:HNH endonuclease signature motif containing protein [Breznakia pachnodae]MDQ0362110.1 hypothetical protein [Breznakia pachnodae]